MQDPIKIALLGGGQLGRMFIENALRYGVEIHVMDPDPQAPCASVAHRFVCADLNDEEAIVDFAKDADVVGIEIEHVSVRALERLKGAGKRVIPDPGVLRTIQDKGLQKTAYQVNGIPTPAFALVEGASGINDHPELLPAFLKLRMGGYDGRGVMSVDRSNLNTAFDAPCVLEKQVAIRKELAVIVVRDEEGGHVCYDPVEMVFDERFNLVDHLRAPARLSVEKAAEAKELAERVAHVFGKPGLYAVELFLTTDERILVNETAPRTHNSGHHTIEACASSQFDQLLRVYLGLPLGDPTLRATAAMVNLIGEVGEGPPQLLGLKEILSVPRTFPHMYGKARTRIGRKMGHISILADDHAGLDKGIAVSKACCKVVPRMPVTSN